MYRSGRRRRGLRGRHPKSIQLDGTPRIGEFIPVPSSGASPIELNLAELEALKLVDLQDLSQEEAGLRMGVSRGTVWRLLHSARRKVAQALTEGRTLTIAQEHERATG
jgi:predicted DNA-binding protein (UPF0251 family)